MTNNASAAEAIAAAIKEEDRAVVWVANRAGIPDSTMRRKLAGGGDFTVSEVARIAAVLRRSPLDLLPAAFQTDEEVAA